MGTPYKCYTRDLQYRGYQLVIKWYPDAEWDSHWSVCMLTEDGTEIGVLPDFCTYTEARKFLEALPTGRKKPVPDEAWTFDPYEVYSNPGWEVYDPNLARVVAVFTDRDEAEEYLRWRNKKQKKKKAKKDEGR